MRNCSNIYILKEYVKIFYPVYIFVSLNDEQNKDRSSF